MITTTTQPVIKCEDMRANLSEFEYGGEPLSIQADKGEIISIIGPDYTGKSDWLRTIAGLHYPLTGTVYYEGKDIHELDDKEWTRQRIDYAYVKSDTALLSAASGLANVMLPARYHKIADTDEIESMALKLILELDANQATYKLPAYVRRDQRFKLAVARALIMQPKVLLLDNPFAILDTIATRKFKNMLLGKVRDEALTLILVTYDIEFSLSTANKILFVTAEQVYCFDSVAEFQTSNVPAIKEFMEKGPT